MELVLSTAAVILSLISMWFSWWTWRESNRPVVAAIVRTREGGNLAIAYELVVMNVGSRPAVGIRIQCDEGGLQRALTDSEKVPFLDDVRRCFLPESIFPFIKDGESVANSFGVTRGEPSDSTWRPGARFGVTITYRDLSHRRHYTSSMELAIIDSDTFAGSSWGKARP